MLSVSAADGRMNTEPAESFPPSHSCTFPPFSSLVVCDDKNAGSNYEREFLHQ